MTTSWSDIASGATVVEPGSARRNLTGSWGTKHPVIDFSRCTHCMICWVMCPDTCYTVHDKLLTGVDLDHCKGCGICVSECPRKCIAMEAFSTSAAGALIKESPPSSPRRGTDGNQPGDEN
ncbi:MAG: 4Fe-4S binding protein [Chloroflexi bacterium]|nr:4Fe-4S binding protein [Chloroflexota bacterium]